ncbi:hypothetical protein HYT05_00600 [Candidatus Kaiserbacteria bacterium]|nr:hypothetical protein [Candidatus Kaiserbacteria bacterium]
MGGCYHAPGGGFTLNKVDPTVFGEADRLDVGTVSTVKTVKAVPFSIIEYERVQLRAERWRYARAQILYYAGLWIILGALILAFVQMGGIKLSFFVQFSGLLWLAFALDIVMNVQWKESDLRLGTGRPYYYAAGGERNLPDEVTVYVTEAKKVYPNNDGFKVHWLGNDPYVTLHRAGHAPKVIVVFDYDENGQVVIKYSSSHRT